VHDQFGDVSAVWLVRRPRGVKLDAADDSFGVTSDQKDRPRIRSRDDLSPPLSRAIERERREKTHRRPRIDGVNQKHRESAEIAVAHRQRQLLERVGVTGHELET